MRWTQVRGAALAAVLAATMLAMAAPAGAGINEGEPPVCNGLQATIWGDDGNNRLYGTPGRDIIHGLGGRDRIWGLGGGDVICGGDGADVLKGQKGRDFLDGGRGRDRIIGGQGPDTLIGGRGDDLLVGGYGNDDLTTGPGDDTALGGAGSDICEMDRRDGYGECEGGDVFGVVATGEAEYVVSVPDEIAAATYVQQGRTVPVYILNVFLTRPDFGPMNYDVRDADGNILIEMEAFGFEYSEQMLIWGEPATISVSNVDYHDITFEKPSLVPVYDSSVEGIGSSVFRFEPPLSSSETLALTVLPAPETFVDIFLVTFTPGVGPSVEIGARDVFDFAEYTGNPTDGATLVGIRALDTFWELSFEV